MELQTKRSFEFERLENGRWYVVFPEYEGDQEDLEMVEGADKMLDALTTDGMYVSLTISEERPEDDNYFIFEMEAHDDCGGFYNVLGCEQFKGTIWLCNVVHEFYEDHPETLYVSLVE